MAAFVGTTPLVGGKKAAAAVNARKSAFLAPTVRPTKAARSATVKMVAEPIAPNRLVQTGDDFADKVINTIRFLSIDAVERANSGHPGMPMGMAPSSFILFDKIMRYNPKNPYFYNRDRFVLSAGHGSMLQYSLMHLFGYESVSMEDIKRFRQLGSVTPGHPENFETPGVEVTTGPLGQGICNAVGLAIAEKHMAAIYNKPDATIVDHYTYAIMGDGCLMEGISGEAASLAGHVGLGKLIALYDDNHISIDGNTEIAFTEDVSKRFEAYGWHVINVVNGNTDLQAIEDAIKEAKSVTDKPSLLKVTTIIGYGSPNKSDSYSIHGAALGPEEVQATRDYLGWEYDQFVIPEDVQKHCDRKTDDGAKIEKEWNENFAKYKEKYPELGQQFENIHLKKQLPDGWEEALKEMGKKEGKAATRQLSNKALNVLAPILPNFWGGSADLASSNLTILKGFGDFQKSTPEGRNLRFGVREHGMGAICNGISLHGSNLIPYCATFFIFTDYMRASMRMAALSQAQVIYVMTHDSVFLGEDGPTHQPIEHLASFRAMPNMNMYRPCDPTEVAAAYAVGIGSKNTPTCIALTRQATAKYEESSFEGAKKGAYILTDNTPSGSDPDIILIGTGSELPLCYDAAENVRKDGKNVRVVSMPCWEKFLEQDESYQKSVFPDSVPKEKRMVVEAGSSFGWQIFASNFHCIDRFGISANGKDVANYFGFTVEKVTEKAKAL
mmetsp:Transcript_9517/g.28759  ORF Transcript_9517/g.28759 Transcript_9517/m.28759 type:complete len:724 (+) Transcript_9517:100-2271(+)|eukprot:CAMPEP_0198727574 /NCGR_PEP_ID=MMETSP1475-20131203/4516_1 /TAXON_ID= ORGANISM="Unidentified sp., Strain CCMP1999" /NCGR_SAMPLE_ID=MMETSP1475 /ASSEMBLY_ACC=CAM_ASM_001111 /LENGTH=723 /DNA_ID=CAMNT_0044489629 /DNA_START=59 /DNA_END=2230 /DNA_ORIENTATION=+